jgi:GrpB-like predicted nucleotidyltransferase (UPF0157 family)
MVGIKDLNDLSENHKISLYLIGYEFVDHPHFPERRFFRKGKRGAGTHHLHIYRYGAENWSSNLLFRNYLMHHPEVIEDYSKLKHHLRMVYMNDRVGYTKAKAPFIQKAIEMAMLESVEESK